MPRILKIYDSGQALAQGEPQVKLIEKYPAFIVAQVADSTVEDIKRTYLAEDITDQYTLPAAGGINTSLPRINALGKTLPHPAYKSAPRLPPGPHHYIVQFIGPIKQAWLTTARKAGADFVQPYEGFSYIARMTTKGVEAVRSCPSFAGLAIFRTRLDFRQMRFQVRAENRTSRIRRCHALVFGRVSTRCSFFARNRRLRRPQRCASLASRYLRSARTRTF